MCRESDCLVGLETRCRARDFSVASKFHPEMRLSSSIKTILINLLTTLVLLIAVEAMLAYGMNNPQKFPSVLLQPIQKFYRTQDRSIIQVTECAEYDPYLFYRMKPGDCLFSDAAVLSASQFPH